MSKEGKQRNADIKKSIQDIQDTCVRQKIGDKTYVKIPAAKLREVIEELLALQNKGHTIGLSTYQSPDSANTYLTMELLDEGSPTASCTMGWKTNLFNINTNDNQ